MSGIINFSLHKNSKLSLNTLINNGVSFGKMPKVNSFLDLNFRSGKFNFFENYGFYQRKYKNHGFKNSQEFNNENTQLFDINLKNTSHLTKLVFDFNEKNTFSYYIFQNIFQGKDFGNTEVDYVSTLTNDRLQLFESKSKNHSQIYTFDYKVDLKKKDII